MKIAIIDDNAADRKSLHTYIKKFFQEIAEEVTVDSYSEAVSFLKNYNYGYSFIIFDIDMPEISGIDAAKELRKNDPNVVLMFVTNMPQYALEGFAVDAVDYVLKPISYPDFKLKMQKAMRYIKVSEDHSLAISTTEGYVQVLTSDIYYIESQLHYATYHTKQGDYRTRASLRDIEPNLTGLHFVRCSNSYLVNLKYVEAIQGNDVTVAGTPLPISRGKKNSFMSEFTKYAGGIRS